MITYKGAVIHVDSAAVLPATKVQRKASVVILM